MKRQTSDLHARFRDWLLAGSDEELPRDVAVHASVCGECQASAAAMDMLTAVDPSQAGMPPLRNAVLVDRYPTRRRVALATGGALAATAFAAVATGALRLPPRVELNGTASPGGGAPTQEVLGNTGVPQASPTSAAPSPRASARATARPSLGASTPPLVSIAPTTAPILTPAATPTQRPGASRTPRPSASNPPATPSPLATPSLTPEEPTPTPSFTETPSPLP